MSIDPRDPRLTSRLTEDENGMIDLGHEYLDFRNWLEDNYPDGEEMIEKFDKENSSKQRR